MWAWGFHQTRGRQIRGQKPQRSRGAFARAVQTLSPNLATLRGSAPSFDSAQSEGSETHVFCLVNLSRGAGKVFRAGAVAEQKPPNSFIFALACGGCAMR